MPNKPEYTESDLTRWQEAIASGSSVRFGSKNPTTIHSLPDLETFLGLSPGTLAPVSPQLAESLASVENLQKTIAGLEARVVELEQASALPANALEIIQSASGLSKPKAESVLSALLATSLEAATDPSE